MMFPVQLSYGSDMSHHISSLSPIFFFNVLTLSFVLCRHDEKIDVTYEKFVENNLWCNLFIDV